MPPHEIDISWQVLRRIVQDWAGTAAELAEVKPLVGGCINITLSLKLRDGAKAVLKISPHRVSRAYQTEAWQLNILRDAGLPTPQIYECRLGSLDAPFSYLLMEFMDGVDLSKARQRCSAEQFDHLQMHLAEMILLLHERTAGHYRRICPEDTPQFESWSAFYFDIYDPIWRDIEKSPLLPVKCRKQIARLHGKLDHHLPNIDRPRLVHWDMWSTNLLAAPDTQGRWYITAILDPNCKFAHAEAEIAYMELFQTITPAFLRAYQQTHKLSGEYHRLRKHIYQLYPLINHVHLFGAEYVKPLMGVTEKLATIV